MSEVEGRTAKQPLDQRKSSIVLGGGCFWCLEAVFQRIPGISSVTPGYAGGSVSHPTYEQVCTGSTGHAEVLQIEYDPGTISLRNVLDLFFKAHDPTTLNRQGGDEGTQYRSIAFYANEKERQSIEDAKETAQDVYLTPIVTEILPLTHFFPAEKYHHNYFNQNPQSGYCRYVIAPKITKLGLSGS